MIAYRKCGTDMGGLVRYLLGPGRHNEHENPRVVGSSDVLSVPTGRELTNEERADLTDQLDWPSEMHGAEVPDGHVWHLSLTADPGDRPLTDQEWADIAGRVMREIGVDDPQRAAARWVVVHHGQNEAGAHHVHVALNLVRDDGSHVSTWQDQKKLSNSVREIEQDYGLTVIDARWKGTGVPASVRGEMERASREGRPEVDRSHLERVVRAAAVISSDEAEFVRRVTNEGVLIRPRMSDDGRWVIGYAVALDRGSEPPIWYSGGNLKKDLSLPGLRRHWTGSVAEIDPRPTWAALGVERERQGEALGGGAVLEQDVSALSSDGGLATAVEAPSDSRSERRTSRQTKAPTERRQGRHRVSADESEREKTTTSLYPEDRRIASTEWDEAHRQVGRAVAHLATVEPGDTATWAYAAREAAGVVAAWSERIEGTPGPLARAAEQLARSAQVRRGDELTRPDDSPLRNLRGVAMVMAQGSLRSDSAAAWALLASQLVELVSQLEATHRAQSEMHRAERLASEARAELERFAEQCNNAGDVREVIRPELAVEVDQASTQTDDPLRVRRTAKKVRGNDAEREAVEARRRQAEEERRKAEEQRDR